MALRYYANAPATTLAASCSSSATSIEVTSTSGLPIQYPYTLIIDHALSTEEVVEVTNASGTTLTVTRGNDSTTAFAHSNGAPVVHGISAQDPREANAHVNATDGVHGVTGDLVGTTDTQTLTNKTIGNTNVLNGFTASKMAVTNGSGQLVAGTSAPPTGTVVGDTDAQTLTNKTLTAPTVTDPETTIGGATVEYVVVSDAAPSHAEGRIWRDSNDTWGRVYVSDGAAWRCVSIDSLPECHVTKSGSQSIPTTTNTKLTWAAASPNVGTMWPGGGSGTLTVPIDGVYAITGQIQWAGVASGIVNVAIWINGSNVVANGGTDVTNNEGNQKAVTITKKLTAGDTIELYAVHNNSSSLDVQDDTGGSGGTNLDVLLIKAL